MALPGARDHQQGSAFHDINVTPMVDVMLVLLIVFMITAPLLASGLKVELPSAQASSAPAQGPDLVVTITSDERIFLGDVEATRNIEEVLLSDPRVQAGHRLFVRGDKNCHYGAVARTVAAAHAAGVTSLNLLVVPEPEEARR